MAHTYFHLKRPGGNKPVIGELQLKQFLGETIKSFESRGYFQKAFGYCCVDEGQVPGEHGFSMANFLLVESLIQISDPVVDHLDMLDEYEILGLHEVLYRIIAKPEGGRFHSFSNCGWHYNSFNQSVGAEEYRERVNRYLALYPPGYQLLPEGELQLILDEPASEILDLSLPEAGPPAVSERVQRAVSRFKKGLSTWDEREAAVRDLGDVLEFLREQVKHKLGRQDERDLFQILNQFAIRHLRQDQRMDYDKPIFLTWFFYEMLAAIHACQQLLDRESRTP